MDIFNNLLFFSLFMRPWSTVVNKADKYICIEIIFFSHSLFSMTEIAIHIQ